MIANIIVIALIVGLAFWWSTQGLFSSLLHMVSTILAGALAFALWEPIVFGLLLERQPQLAWGVGLLAPFIVALLVIRILADKIVPGNLDFHNLVNSIGGGAFGAVSGVITAGLVIIGLQMIGNLDLKYHPYEVSETGEVKRVAKLWVPVDQITATLYTTLSGGSLKPFSGKTLDAYHHDLAKEAATFNTHTRTGARSTLRPSKVKVDRAFVVKTADLKGLKKGDRPAQPRVHVIGLKFPEANATTDKDGQFTASKAQVALVVESEDGERQTVHPYGWTWRKRTNTFGRLNSNTEFIRAKSNTSDFKIDLLFALPERAEPLYLRLKQTRLALPEQDTVKADDAKRWINATSWKAGDKPTVVDVDDNNGDMELPSGGPGSELHGIRAQVSDILPGGIYSKNRLNTQCSNVSLMKMDDRNALASATGSISAESTRIGKTLAVKHIYHPEGTKIVLVTMDKAQAGRTLGKILQSAAALHTPLLYDNEGDKYQAIGYMIYGSKQLYLDFDQSRNLRSVKNIKLDRMNEKDRLMLVFRVPSGITIKQFNIARQTQQLNLRVP